MRLLDSGLIYDFLQLIGVELTTQTGILVAFLVCAALLCVCIVSVMVLLFKFLVYLRKG